MRGVYKPVLVWILCINFSNNFSKKKKWLNFRNVEGNYCTFLNKSKQAWMA